jgi:hypothetical protein
MARPTDTELNDVKPIIYHGDPQVDRFVYGLDNIMQHLGERNQYPYFLGMSGNAFKVAWSDSAYHPERFSDSTPAPEPAGLHDVGSVEAALKATGYGFEILGNRACVTPHAADGLGAQAGNAEVRETTLASIADDRRPVLVLMHLNGRLDWRILTGYAEGGNEIVGWPGFGKEQTATAEFVFRPDGTFSAADWERKVAALIRLVGDKDTGFLEKQKALYRDALERALTHTRPHSEGGTARGLAAYDACLEALEEADGDVSDDIVAQRLGYFALAFLGDLVSNRHYASLFFATMMKGWNSSALYYAAGNCAKIHELVWDCWNLAGGFWRNGDTEIPRFRNRENRKRIAAIVREIRNLDENTAEQIGLALDGWDKGHGYYMQSE